MFRLAPEPELFPVSLEERVGPLVVRLKAIAEEVAGPRLRKLYQPQGGVAYDPVGLFCVLVFGLMRRTSSSRELEERICFDLRFQYLMSSQTVDHSTIARFRRLLGEALPEIATTVLVLAKHEGLVDGKNVAVDGTKIEANTSQWRKLLDQTVAAEDEPTASASTARTHSDPDAQLMKHRRTGVIRGYNAQVAVDMGGSGLILANFVSNKAKDSEEMEPFIQEFEHLDQAPEVVVADAGYDSAPNHDALEAAHITGYITPHGDYDSFWKLEDGQLRCPAGHSPVFERQRLVNGVPYDSYIVRQCSGCSLKAQCGVKKYKTISARAGFNPAVRVANAHRSFSSEGQSLKRKRSPIVEGVFGHIKANRSSCRFKLRGMQGVTTEFNLICLAYNLEKLLRALHHLLLLILGRKMTFKSA